MNWHLSYTPHIWPSFITIFFLLVLCVYSWHRRNVSGALPFAIGCLFAALWAVGSVMEYAAVELATKIFWFKFQAACQLPIIIAITCFILEYAWPGRWLTRRNLILLSIPWLLVLGLLLTNDLHHLIWRSFAFDETVTPLLGLGGWVFIVYAFGVLGIVNIIAFAWLFLRSPPHRWPVVFMLIGQIGGQGVYLLEKAFVLHADLPLGLLGMVFQFLMYTIALFGFRILDPIALACQTMIEQLHDGMLVLDFQGRVTSLNPSAQAILGVSAKRAKGLPARDLLPEYATVTGNLPAEGADWVEFSRETESETSVYALTTSALKDWRKLTVGHLLLLHDVTEQKQAQARLVEQQRALAMLHEREQLARELHDSIGQVLGYAGFQMEAVTKLILDGQLEIATSQLNRLVRIIREAHADVREYILDLHTAPAPQQPFFAALRNYLDGFTQNYGIQTLLSVDEQLGDELFPTDARLQVFRILQEALSNARKHGRAYCVQVTFAMEDQFVRMTIQDDGTGFNPAQSTTGSDSHFGLQFMRERAEALGGRLDVITNPGQGTKVVTHVPMRTTSPIQENEVNNA